MSRRLPPFFYLRHGQTAWNKERRIQGQIDTELNALGHLQAEAMGKKLLDKNIKQVVFDRNGFFYHGRVKQVADGAREAGLEF